MKKIIFVSGIQIFPPESGGQLRSANFCQSLARLGHSVEIYSFTGRKAEYLKRESSQETKIAENLVEYVNRNPLLGLIQFIFYKFHLPPFWLCILTKFLLPKNLKQKLKNCDTLVLDFPFLYPIAKHCPATLRVNTHNAEFELYADKPRTQAMVKKIELSSFKAASEVFFCNLSDMDKFTKDYPELKTKSLILPNGINLASFIFNNQDRNVIRNKYHISSEQKVFLFTGSSYKPNIDAYEFLSKWAQENADFLIKEKMTFLIVGTVTDKLFDSPYLKVVGRVKEIYPFFWASDFGLNPIASGSGTNVKMIEFLAAKLPILTTLFGARGLELVDQETCLMIDLKNFKEVLQRAGALDESAQKNMAQKAQNINLPVIDMGHALKNLNLKW